VSSLRGVLLLIAPVLLSASFFIGANGLFGTLLSVRLDLDGVRVDAIGLVMACYSVGWVIGALICPRIIRQVGHIRAFAAFAAIVAAMALAHPLLVDPVLWAVLRVLCGLCMAAMFTITESWLNAMAPSPMRGQVMSVYMIVTFGAFGAAQFLLTVTDPSGYELFSLVAMLAALSLVPLALSRVRTPSELVDERFMLGRLIGISPLGVAGCTVAGLINGAFFAIGPVYARTFDPSATWVATFLMINVLGGLLLQIPIGRLSDRFDRRQVIFFVCLALALFSYLVTLAPADMRLLLLGILAVQGGVAYTLYPLSLAHANDHLDPQELVPASGGLLLCFGTGAALGSVTGSLAMSLAGPQGLFYQFALVSLALALFTAWRMTRRPPVPNEEQASFVAVPQTTMQAEVLDPRAEDEQMSLDLPP
jgi:MFS family permease